MLALAAGLRERYRITLLAVDSREGLALLSRADAMGLETRALNAADDARACAEFARTLRRSRPDVCHLHAGISWEGHALAHLAHAAGVPCVVRTEHLPFASTARWYLSHYQALCRNVDRFICVSRECAQTYLAAGLAARQFRVVQNGIGAPRPSAGRAEVLARLGLGPAARIVLTVARLSEQKGHRYLLEAIPFVLKQEPHATFVWVGDGPLRAELSERARALRLGDRLRLLGTRDDVPDLLAAADAFVLPSLFEGLPIVLLEAMQLGLPLVATDVCGTSELLRDRLHGRLIPLGHITRLAEALVELLQDTEQARRLGAAARAHVEREFSAARMARETAAIYEEVLAEKGALLEHAA